MPESSTQMKADTAQPSHAQVSDSDQAILRDQAIRAARACGWLGGKSRSAVPQQMFRKSARQLSKLERELYNLRSGEPTEDLKALYDNLRLIRSDVQDLQDSTKILTRLPSVRTPEQDAVPRPI